MASIRSFMFKCIQILEFEDGIGYYTDTSKICKTGCLSPLSFCFDKSPTKATYRESFYVSSQFKVAVYHGREATVTGALGCQSH